VDKFEQDRQMSNLLALVASRSANRDRVQTGPSLMRQPSSAAGVSFFLRGRAAARAYFQRETLNLKKKGRSDEITRCLEISSDG